MEVVLQLDKVKFFNVRLRFCFQLESLVYLLLLDRDFKIKSIV
jgi:hypothetical protein